MLIVAVLQLQLKDPKFKFASKDIFIKRDFFTLEKRF